MLAGIIERGMVRTGRLTRLQVQLRDIPGALSKVTACLAQANANIEEVHHERAFTRSPVQSADVDFVLQTRGHDHVRAIIAALEAAGFSAKRHDGDWCSHGGRAAPARQAAQAASAVSRRSSRSWPQNSSPL